LDVNPDWRWMLEKNDSHWYNNVQLLRLAQSTKEIKNFLRGLS
jgi:hypothetical protein